ncbi:tripartite motif-containing protein 42 isoform X2 [Hemicordylus capensis]|uniref:tripartite motif-containing protein 42 isoform X2 n=1 Tax=Hemicordylus capensis TaxID=884348 RepID=UPI002303993D|nr:tripartite motif-containing protein 42 isoform X2 [Hemicordylus capensis]
MSVECACCLATTTCPDCHWCNWCPCCRSPCCSGFGRFIEKRCSKECNLCWRFLCEDEQNCDCCYCPRNETRQCQCCHCSCSENPNCRCCCCSCANNPYCKCCCCSPENTECQCYECRCCTFTPFMPYRLRHPYGDPNRFVAAGSRNKSDTSIISLTKDASGHAFLDQLICPMCKRLFLHPFMLPCNHCLCDRCIVKSQIHAEITENFFIITCPICSKAHCLPLANKIQLRINYLRARLARKYMRRAGFLRWRFDKTHVPIYCQVCIERRKATKRCMTCQLNYCNICLRSFHQDISTQNHMYTKVSEEFWEERNCLIHTDAMLSKYCLDDHELLCEFCCDAQHRDHDTVLLASACSTESAALFTAIAKFKKVRYAVDNDLMEVLVLKNNFKSYKESKRREIRIGFLRLRSILQEREKEMMEAVENLELQKQRGLVEFAEYTSNRIAQMDSLIQYSKEALKEKSQIAFLQSANSLINEIEDVIANIYQPSPYLTEDPIKHLKVDFEEISDNLRSIFPSLSMKLADKNKYPYLSSSDVMFPGQLSSTRLEDPLRMTRSQSLTSLTTVYDSDLMENELSYKSKSLPPPNVRDHGMYAFWDAASETEDEKATQTSRNQEAFEDSSAVPGLVVIYQTLVYPTVAKVVTPDARGKAKGRWGLLRHIQSAFHKQV